MKKLFSTNGFTPNINTGEEFIMATVQGPLLSVNAHGMLKKTILFRRINKRNVVSLNSGSPKTSTPRRDGYACLMHCARAQWRTLTGEQRAVWEQLALTQPPLSGYNLFVKDWFEAHNLDAVPIFNCTPFDWSFFASSGSVWSLTRFDLFHFDNRYFQ
jgi:hypothetical protein